MERGLDTSGPLYRELFHALFPVTKNLFKAKESKQSKNTQRRRGKVCKLSMPEKIKGYRRCTWAWCLLLQV
ncbi:hypothetical protein NC652_009763 [Populus alba x Populus x berolinensis]|nr:hypothetical protein NC652_009763 [Populus alba x Populus x berolinensis]